MPTTTAEILFEIDTRNISASSTGRGLSFLLKLTVRLLVLSGWVLRFFE